MKPLPGSKGKLLDNVDRGLEITEHGLKCNASRTTSAIIELETLLGNSFWTFIATELIASTFHEPIRINKIDLTVAWISIFMQPGGQQFELVNRRVATRIIVRNFGVGEHGSQNANITLASIRGALLSPR